MINQIFCLDVDGTIVAREGNFYPQAEWMCKQLSNLNWNLVLCSARPIQSLISLAEKIKNIRWVCGLGGAVISKQIGCSATGESFEWKICHHTDFIVQEALTPIFKWAIDNNITDIWAYDSTGWYVTTKTVRVERETFITGINPQICSLADMPREKLLKLVFPHIPNELMQSMQICAESQGLFANYSTDTQVEINTPLASDKGVKELRKLMFANQKTIVASLGDGANDFGMLSASDLPFTFSDGHPSLTKIARSVFKCERDVAYSELLQLLSSKLYL